jgi:hypothetical protein
MSAPANFVPPFDLPPSTSPFIGVYELNSPLGEQSGEIVRTSSYSVQVVSGPFQFSRSVPLRRIAAGFSGIAMGQQLLEFPPGRYLVIETERIVDEPLNVYSNASLEVNQVATSIAILFPGLIAGRKFEGFVNKPGQWIMAGPGPIDIVARSDDDPEKVRKDLEILNDALSKADASTRERFQLASRWYAQGQFAENQIDKLLSWFISLEVHPAYGTTDVPGAVRDYLHSRVYPDLSPENIKKKLQIGPITGMRAAIVHDGQSHVELADQAVYTERLRILDAIVRTCLRCLAGIQPGDALDSFVGIAT